MRHSFEDGGNGSGFGGFKTREEMDQAWKRVRSTLCAELGADKFDSWISPLSLENVANGCATLEAPKEYLRYYVELHFRDHICRVWKQESNAIKRVRVKTRSASYLADQRFAKSNLSGQHAEEAGKKGEVFAPKKLDERQSTVGKRPPLSSAFRETSFGAKSHMGATSVSSNDLGSEFNSAKTFETFVHGEPNEFAFVTAQSFAQSPNQFSGSLYIYGRPGAGKTHLLNAIGQSIQEKSPNLRLMYLSAERFAYYFFRALQNKDTLSFKDALTNSDVLLLDDVQFLSNKGATQEEFFHILDILLTSGKKVVCCADVPPSELDGVKARIIARLVQGEVVPVGLPDVALRRRILESKLSLLEDHYNEKFVCEDEILDYLAKSLNSDVRSLEGAIVRIVMLLRAGKEVNLDAVRSQIVSDLIKAGPSDLTIQAIQDEVAKYFNLTVENLRSKRRTKDFVLARHIAMYLCKELTTKSYPQIAAKFGGKDHTTILHAHKKITKALDHNEDKCDESTRQHIAALKRMLGFDD